MAIHRSRGYQLNLIARTESAWSAGHNHVMIVLPTGGGKTHVVSVLVERSGVPAACVAHRSELVGQMSQALAREGVYHRIIGSDALRRNVVAAHVAEFGRSYYQPNSRTAVCSVDTLLRIPKTDPWLQSVGLVVIDEGHHVLKTNKWGRAFALFPRARCLAPTATPTRADGKGLGAHADGLMDVLIEGPSMRDLIDSGYLTDYRVFAPASNLDLSSVHMTASGDFSPQELKSARQRSTITGDVVGHYLRIARGKLGVTFDTDVESATQTAAAFRAAGVPAEVVTGDTPDALRQQTLRRFKNREILQLVNVDLFGEGFDLPAIEVVSMARPTQSFSLYCLDPETEVLTPSGWLDADAALRSASVIAFDATTGECREEAVTGSVRRPMLDGEVMYAVKSPHLDLCVSDRHRMLVRGNSGTCRNWQFETAQQAAQRRGMFRVPVAGMGRFPGSGLSADELRFLGWFLSDGNRNRKTNGIAISQSLSKPAHVAAIEGVLRACGFKYGRTEVKRTGSTAHCEPSVLFTVSHGGPRGRDRHLRGYESLAEWCDKSLPSCYDRLTREEFLTLLSTLYLGDGWNNHACADWTPRTMRIACGSSKRFADRLQALCVVRGLRCNVATFRGPNGVDWYIAYVKDTTTSSLPGTGTPDGSVLGKKAYRRSRLAPSAQRPSFVWCLTNTLGTLITRRRGKVCVVGNCQQFGRSLRLMIDPKLMAAWETFTPEQRRAHIAASGKPTAIVLDHVGNVLRHGLPDRTREWTLDGRERRSRSAPTDVVPLRVCTNAQCLAPYERVLPACPHCGTVPEIADRSKPELVDGDLGELDPAVLAALRGEIRRIDADPVYPANLSGPARSALARNHAERQDAQKDLRAAISLWAGWLREQGMGDAETYRRFFHKYRVDVATAQTLNAKDAAALAASIRGDLAAANVTEKTDA